MKHNIRILCVFVVLAALCMMLTACASSGIKNHDDIESNKKISSVDLSDLDDDELIEAVMDNIYYKTASVDASMELDVLNQYERNFYMAFWFDSEVLWDGLYFYFWNFSDTYLPYAEDALVAVGAIPHAELFAEFCEENQIKIDDPVVKNFRNNEYLFKNNEEAFYEFDSKYYDLIEMMPIEPLLASYIRDNIENFGG